MPGEHVSTDISATGETEMGHTGIEVKHGVIKGTVVHLDSINIMHFAIFCIYNRK